MIVWCLNLMLRARLSSAGAGGNWTMRLRPGGAAVLGRAPTGGTYVLGHSDPAADVPPTSGWHKEDGHLSPSAVKVAHARRPSQGQPWRPSQPTQQPPVPPPVCPTTVGNAGEGVPVTFTPTRSDTEVKVDTSPGESAAAVAAAAAAAAGITRARGDGTCDAPSTALLMKSDADAPPAPLAVPFGAPPPAGKMFGLPQTASPILSIFTTEPPAPVEPLEPSEMGGPVTSTSDLKEDKAMSEPKEGKEMSEPKEGKEMSDELFRQGSAYLKQGKAVVKEPDGLESAFRHFNRAADCLHAFLKCTSPSPSARLFPRCQGPARLILICCHCTLQHCAFCHV